MEFEIAKQFSIVAVAVWILCAAIYRIPKLEKYIPKELMGYIIGIITLVIGILTGYFVGHPLGIILTGIIAIYVSQGTYDKVKAIFKQMK